MYLFRLLTVLSLLALWPLYSFAQIAAQADPADPQFEVPALNYKSAFTDYKPFGDAKLGSWKALNERVRGGGMRDMKGMGDMKEMGDMKAMDATKGTGDMKGKSDMKEERRQSSGKAAPK
jgi:hypothetical protein